MATLWRQNLSRSLAGEGDFCVILESYATDQVHETRAVLGRAGAAIVAARRG